VEFETRGRCCREYSGERVLNIKCSGAQAVDMLTIALHNKIYLMKSAYNAGVRKAFCDVGTMCCDGVVNPGETPV